MREFFRGWRRKLGCAALLVALSLSGAWIRSLIRQDDLHTPFFSLHIHCGTVSWFGDLDVGWKWHTLEINADNRTGFAGVWGWSRDSIAVPYWSLIVPPSLLSAVLLLWPQGKAKRGIDTEQAGR